MSDTTERTVGVAIGPRPIHPRPIHPRHGLHAPRTALLPRRPGSIRRTVTIDTVRPGEILGDAVQIAVGRDLRTHLDGSATVVRDARVRTEFAYSDHYRLISIETDPIRDELRSLVGTSVSTGFRAAMLAAVPAEQQGATLLHALLDDLPGAALVSGYAIGHAGKYPVRKEGAPVLQIEGLCAGFQRDGTILAHMTAEGTAPVVTGPPAPTLLDPDDPVAWHALREMGAHDMRRWRRLDVTPGATPTAPVAVEVDPVERTITRSAATAHSLPWVECIEAEASGDRLAGLALEGLRPLVREDFVGVSTCTHLNDTLRSVEDVRALLPDLSRPPDADHSGVRTGSPR
jgi:hypothetical protein